VILLRSLGLSVALEPMNFFRNHEPDDDNRRPDILIRNPYGGGKQITIDVALTGIDGITRTNDDKPEQALVAQRKQKKEKCGRTAKLNGLAFIAGIFSYAGQMEVVIKNLFLEQIKFKLQLVNGEVKKSKVRAIMKHCVRSISVSPQQSIDRQAETSSSRLPKRSTWHDIPYKTSPLPLLATSPPLLPQSPRRTFSKNSNYKS
jgi:hypothetical protein